jgi:hypothetical protein
VGLQFARRSAGLVLLQIRLFTSNFKTESVQRKGLSWKSMSSAHSYTGEETKQAWRVLELLRTQVGERSESWSHQRQYQQLWRLIAIKLNVVDAAQGTPTQAASITVNINAREMTSWGPCDLYLSLVHNFCSAAIVIQPHELWKSETMWHTLWTLKLNRVPTLPIKRMNPVWTLNTCKFRMYKQKVGIDRKLVENK